jgi:hypothetical protein
MFDGTGRLVPFVPTRRDIPGPDSFHRQLVKSIRLTFDDTDGVSRAFTKARSEPVAQIVGGKNRLSVDNLYRPFRAGRNAESAAVTFFPIYFDDFSPHGLTLLYLKDIPVTSLHVKL